MTSLLSLPPELVGVIHSFLSYENQSKRAFASSCKYIRSSIVLHWSSLRVDDRHFPNISRDNSPLLSVPAGMTLRRLRICKYTTVQGDAAPHLLNLFLPDDEETAQKVKFNLQNVEDVVLMCDVSDGAYTLGRFLGSLKRLHTLEVSGVPEPAFFKGLAEGGSKLRTLSVENVEPSASVSQGIALLNTLCSLNINASSCDVAPLSSLKQLTDLVIVPYMDNVEADVEVRGLLEGVAGMQELSFLRLPRAPSNDVLFALPQNLETIRLGSTTISDVIRIASCDGLPALRIEVIDLDFSGIRDMSDAHRAGAVLSSRWQPGTRHERIMFEHAREIACVDAFLHVCACIPGYRYCLYSFSTTDIGSSSWGQLARSGAYIGELILECDLKDLNVLHRVLDSLDTVDVTDISVSLHGYEPGCASKVLAFSAGCALRSRNKDQNVTICGGKLLYEVTDEPLVQELSATDDNWELLRADLQSLRVLNGLRSVTVEMSSIPPL